MPEVRSSNERRWVYPLANWTRVSRQGIRNGRAHRGVDFFAPRGTAVRSMGDGLVITRVDGWAPGYTRYGNSVRVEHDDGTVALYTHLGSVSVQQGDRVLAGDTIGTIGTSAGTRENPQAQFASSRPHTHIEVHPSRRTHPAIRNNDQLSVREWMAQRGLNLTSRRTERAAAEEGEDAPKSPDGSGRRWCSACGSELDDDDNNQGQRS